MEQQQQADPRMAAMMDKAARQAVKVLTSEAGATSIARDAKTRGPAVAITSALDSVVAGITQAAEGAGVMLPEDVVAGVKDAMSRLLVAMMVGSGLAEDPDALMEELQSVPASPGTNGNEREQTGPVAEGAPPGGALAQMRGGM